MKALIISLSKESGRRGRLQRSAVERGARVGLEGVKDYPHGA